MDGAYQPWVKVTFPDKGVDVVVAGSNITYGTELSNTNGMPPVSASNALETPAAGAIIAAIGRYATNWAVPLNHDADNVMV